MTERWLTYREFVDEMKADVAREAQTLKGPEADWRPRVYFQGAKPDRPFQNVPIPMDLFSSTEVKEHLFLGLAAFIRATGIRLFGLQVTQYVSFVTLSDAESQQVFEDYTMPSHLPMPSKDPDRLEVVSLNVFDAERHESWYAPMRRRRYARPLLDEWELFGEGPNSMIGLMVEPLIEALR